MIRKLLSLSLALAMLCSFLPAAAAAEETEFVPTVIKEENGVVYFLSESVQSGNAGIETASEEDLIQLATPYDLRWGIQFDVEYDSTTGSYELVESSRPGYVSCKVESPCQNRLCYRVYQEGSDYVVTSWTNVGPFYKDESLWSSSHLADTRVLESGNYYFTVTSEGDGTQYRDSETVTSDVWKYTKPDAQLSVPTHLYWDEGNAYFTLPDEDATAGYYIRFFFSKTLSDEPRGVGGILSSRSVYDHDNLPDHIIQSNGSGYYYFTVMAVSQNIEKVCNSEFAEISEPIFISAENSDLDSIVENASEMTDDEIRDAVQGIGAEDLEQAMLADQNETGAVAQLKELEEEVGGPAGVEVTDEVSAFDADKVSVVGANLNTPASETDQITLVLDKPEKEHVIPENYDNSVAISFSMDLTNVENTEELAVPVQITLPIPGNINPEFLVILHYHSDGSVEEVSMPYVYSENGQYYAKFVVNSFSDFVLTQYASDDAHEHDYAAVTTEPTCTEGGFTTYTCSCGDTYTGDEVPALGHTEEVDAAVAATCTETGLTEGKHCSVCEDVLTKQEVVPALGHSWDEGVVTREPTVAAPGIKTYTCEVCEETRTEEIPYEGTESSSVQRIYGQNRIETAIAVAEELKSVLNVEKFDSIILAAGGSGSDQTKFADALSGSYLATSKGAPILLYTKGDLSAQNLAFIQENLNTNGTIYLLGGNVSIPAEVEDALKAEGYNTKRLGGTDRYDTNLIILKEAGIDGADEILVASGRAFADSLSASATGLPIMLVNGTKTELTDAQVEFLQSVKGKKITILGGTAAVTAELEAAINEAADTEADRIFGNARENTSAMVAQKYFADADTALIAYSRMYPDGLAGGVLANSLKAPLLLTKAGSESIANEYIEESEIEVGYVLGGTAVLTDDTARAVFGLSESAVIESK